MRSVGAVLLVIGIVLCGIMGTMNIVRWLDFKSNCGDYLKLAGDAPTIEKAEKYLGLSIDYIKSHGLNQGNSAFIFRTPQNDLGIWSEQLTGGRETLTQIMDREKANPGSVTQLEKDNALMKLREVLLDSGESGTSVTTPGNITVAPYQWFFLIGWIVAIVIVAFGALVVVAENS
jgi:hypothetical protein